MSKFPKFSDNEESFVTWCVENGYSSRTIELYLGALRRFHSWADEKGLTLETISASGLMAYMTQIPNTWSTRTMVRSAMLAYWQSIQRADIPCGALRVPKKERAYSKALEESDAAKLALAAENSKTEVGLMIILGLYLGLRRFEIASLRWEFFRQDNTWLRVIGKGNKTADLPVHPIVTKCLKTHVKPEATGYIFPGRWGGPTNPERVWELVQRFSLEHLGFKIGVHVLRHTCLTTANDSTADLRAVQEFARHSRPETTAIYTRVAKRRIVGVMNSIDYKAVAAAAAS